MNDYIYKPLGMLFWE